MKRSESRVRLGGFLVSFALFVAPLAANAAPLGTAADPGVQAVTTGTADSVVDVAQISVTQPSTIAGTVKDSGGKVIAGAKASLTGPVAASTLTARDGSFKFAGLKAGSYLVTIEDAGYATINTTISVNAGEAQTTQITLERGSQTTLRTIGRVVTSRNSTQLSTTPAATNTVSSQTYIQRGQPQVSNLLEELPGVELQRFSSGGGPGANTVAALRGADPAETQILIDGHPVSGGPESNYLLQFLNPLLLSDIEVTKGPGTFGNQIVNQVNGSINFRTPAITREFSALATVGYDTYNGSTDSLKISDTIGKFGFLAGYAVFGTPGYNTDPTLSIEANGTPQPGLIPDGTATFYVPASQEFHNHSELFKLGYDFSNSTAVSFSYLGLHTYADYTNNLTTLEPFHIVAACPTPTNPSAPTGPGTGAGCGANSNSGQTSYTNPALLGLVGKTVYGSSTQDNLYLGNFETDNEPFFTGDLRTTFGPGSFLARYYAASISRDLDDPGEVNQPYQCDDPSCSAAAIAAAGDFQGPFYQTQTDYLHGADFQYAIPVGPNTYTASYDTHGDRASSCSGGNANPAGSRECSVPSILQTFQSIGIRGDLHFGSKVGVALANYFSHATFVPSRSDPRLGITYQPNAGVVIRASVGSSFVAPSASYANGVTPHIDRNTLDLNLGPVLPETSVSYDVGSDVRTGGDSKLALDVYATRLFNRFESTTVSAVVGPKVSKIQYSFNEADALEKGIELTYLKEPAFGFGSNDYLDLERAYAGNSNPNFSAGGTIYGNVADGQQFTGYPFTHGRLALNYKTRNDIRSEFGADYYGALNSFHEPGFVLFDANVQARLKASLQLTVSVQNIFNHDSYRTFGEYNYGTSQPALGSGDVYSSLFFAPPRQITVQLSRQIGNPNP